MPLVFSDPSLNSRKPQWLVQSTADLARHEGFREYAYPDPLSLLGKRYVGKKFMWGFQPGDLLLAKYGEKADDGKPWTIGFGFTRGVFPNQRITLQQAAQRLEDEIIKHVPILDKLTPNWGKMPLFAQSVLVNLAYNLGEQRLAKFAPTLALFEAHDWAGAAAHLKASVWYKQVGARSSELVARLENEKIEDAHLAV